MEKGAAITKPGAGFRARLFRIISRLAIWYVIFTLIFRCPASRDGLVDSSPLICKPYLAVRSHLAPYAKPYYEAYAAPYVDSVLPYAESFYRHIYVPASAFAFDNYSKYAAPRVAQAKAYGQFEWERTVVPRVELLKGKVEEQYGVLLEPYVKRIDAAISPPLQSVKGATLRQYRAVIVPTYQSSIPYVEGAYDYGQKFVVDIGVPYSVWIYDGILAFLHRRVWPPLRIVYGRNVEPQLSRIRERLSSYRDSKKLEDAVEAAHSSAISDQIEPGPPMESSVTITAEFSTDESFSTESPTSSSSVAEPIPSTDGNRGKLTHELKSWQAKFTKASDNGAEDLSIRVADITARQIETQANGLGNTLVTQLDEASDRELGKLKSIILDAVQALPEDSTEEDQNAAYSSVVSALRAAGSTIKDKAQELRVWKIKFRQETESLVQAASDSTLDVIDNIRDLGLQEIGMRWAAMDSVTYQDWAEYHRLKKTFDDWRVQIGSIASEHEGLAKARQYAEDIEDRGMAIAQDAAAELARLKDVARWKLHAQDASDDFSSRQLSAAAARLGQRIKEMATDANSYVESLISTQGLAESVLSVASEGAINAVSSASSIVAGPLSQVTSNVMDSEDQEATVQKRTKQEQLASSIIKAIREKASKRGASSGSESFLAEDLEFLRQPMLESILSGARAKIKTMTAGAFENGQENLGEVAEEAGETSGMDEAAGDAAITPLPSEDTPEEIEDATPSTASASSLVDFAPTQIPKQVSEASEAAMSAADEYESSAASAYGQASGTITEVATIASQTAMTVAEDLEFKAAFAHDRVSAVMADAISTVGEAATAAVEELESNAESAYDWASTTFENTISQISEAAKAAKEYESSGESAYISASASVANAASVASDDFINKAQSVSENIQSQASDAGPDYSSVTRTLHPVASEFSKSLES